ncbi:hypothetical protein JCM14036_13700 [Desulfotomaculum defluvii]
MLRNALFFVLVGAFVIVVGFGVYIANEYFNRLVLPEQPASVFALSRQDSGNLEIDFLGEKLEVNTAAIEKYADNSWEIAADKLVSLKNNSQIHEKVHWLKETVQEQYQRIIALPEITEKATLVKEVVNQHWQELLASEKVQAVNQWIRDKSAANH